MSSSKQPKILDDLGTAIRQSIGTTMKGVQAVSQGFGDAVKDATVYSIQAAGDAADSSIHAVAIVSKGCVQGASGAGMSLLKAARAISKGTTKGAKESGKDIAKTARQAVKSIVLGAAELKEKDIAGVGTEAVEGAIEGTQEAGEDVKKTAQEAVAGALEAADEIGGSAPTVMRKSLRKFLQKTPRLLPGKSKRK